MAHWPSIVNMANSVIGVSVLAMPFVIQQCGLIWGGILTLFSSWLSKLSCKILLYAAYKCRKNSYERLSMHAFGPVGKLVTEISVILQLFGTCVACFIVVGDQLPVVMAKAGWITVNSTSRSIIMLLACTFVVMPICLSRDLHAVSRLSEGALLFYLLFIMHMGILAVDELLYGEWLSDSMFRFSGTYVSLPILGLSFAGQTTLFMVQEQLPNPNMAHMSDIVSKSLDLCCAFYGAAGYFGYFAFRHDRIAGNILNNYPLGVVATTIMFGFSVSVLSTFPFVVFPTRTSLISLFGYHGDEPLPLSPRRHGESDWIVSPATLQHYGVTALIAYGSLLLAILFPEIETTLSVVGATANTLISYIMPGAVFLALVEYTPIWTRRAKVALFAGIVVSCLGVHSMYTQTVYVTPPQAHDAAITRAVETPIRPVAAAITKPHRTFPVTTMLLDTTTTTFITTSTSTTSLTTTMTTSTTISTTTMTTSTTSTVSTTIIQAVAVPAAVQPGHERDQTNLSKEELHRLMEEQQHELSDLARKLAKQLAEQAAIGPGPTGRNDSATAVDSKAMLEALARNDQAIARANALLQAKDSAMAALARAEAAKQAARDKDMALGDIKAAGGVQIQPNQQDQLLNQQQQQQQQQEQPPLEQQQQQQQQQPNRELGQKKVKSSLDLQDDKVKAEKDRVKAEYEAAQAREQALQAELQAIEAREHLLSLLREIAGDEMIASLLDVNKGAVKNSSDHVADQLTKRSSSLRGGAVLAAGPEEKSAEAQATRVQVRAMDEAPNAAAGHGVDKHPPVAHAENAGQRPLQQQGQNQMQEQQHPQPHEQEQQQALLPPHAAKPPAVAAPNAADIPPPVEPAASAHLGGKSDSAANAQAASKLQDSAHPDAGHADKPQAKDVPEPKQVAEDSKPRAPDHAAPAALGNRKERKKHQEPQAQSQQQQQQPHHQQKQQQQQQQPEEQAPAEHQQALQRVPHRQQPPVQPAAEPVFQLQPVGAGNEVAARAARAVEAAAAAVPPAAAPEGRDAAGLPPADKAQRRSHENREMLSQERLGEGAGAGPHGQAAADVPNPKLGRS